MSRLLFLLLVACQSDWPSTRGINATESYWPGQDYVVAYTRESIRQHRNIDINPPVTIYWATTPCPGRDEPGVSYGDGCYNGLAFRCEEIYVAVKPTFTDTALVHELGHCWRFEASLPRDYDHEDTEWWGFMEVINKELRANGY